MKRQMMIQWLKYRVLFMTYLVCMCVGLLILAITEAKIELFEGFYYVVTSIFLLYYPMHYYNETFDKPTGIYQTSLPVTKQQKYFIGLVTGFMFAFVVTIVYQITFVALLHETVQYPMIQILIQHGSFILLYLSITTVLCICTGNRFVYLGLVACTCFGPLVLYLGYFDLFARGLFIDTQAGGSIMQAGPLLYLFVPLLGFYFSTSSGMFLVDMMLVCFLFSIVTMFIGFILTKKRSDESYGQLVSFPRTRILVESIFVGAISLLLLANIVNQENEWIVVVVSALYIIVLVQCFLRFVLKKPLFYKGVGKIIGCVFLLVVISYTGLQSYFASLVVPEASLCTVGLENGITADFDQPVELNLIKELEQACIDHGRRVSYLNSFDEKRIYFNYYIDEQESQIVRIYSLSTEDYNRIIEESIANTILLDSYYQQHKTMLEEFIAADYREIKVVDYKLDRGYFLTSLQNTQLEACLKQLQESQSIDQFRQEFIHGGDVCYTIEKYANIDELYVRSYLNLFKGTSEEAMFSDFTKKINN